MSRTSSGGSKDAPSALQGARWILGSIFTSVSCVMCNKRIFSLFPVPFALTATHFALTTMAQQLRGQTGNTGDLTMRHGQGGRPPPSNSQSKTSKSSSARSSSVEIKRGALPLYEAAKIGFLGNAAIGIMNLSLGKNSVAFYQLTKVSLVPGMVAFNFFVYRKTTPVRVCASLLLITIGLTLATVTDTNISAFGFATGIVAVCATVLFQISMEHAQREHSVSGLETQLAIAPFQFLSAVAFFLCSDEPRLLLHHMTEAVVSLSLPDLSVKPAAPIDEKTLYELLFWWGASCLSAQLTNYYCYTIIGVFSALTYQVVAHAKTILVLSGGLLFFAEQATWDLTHIVGLVLTVVGIVWYSRVKMHIAATENSSSAITLPSNSGASSVSNKTKKSEGIRIATTAAASAAASQKKKS